MRGLRPWLMLAACLLAGAGGARAQQVAAVNRAIEYLKHHVPAGAVGPGRMGSGMAVGETALVALAMVKAEVSHDDPALVQAMRVVESRFSSGGAYTPALSGGTDIYEAGVVILALANYDPVGRKAMIASAADYIMSKQKGNGCWDYDNRQAGDASISQYAVLGLWEAENAGVRVRPNVWDNAARWYMSVQGASGGWTYHRDENSTGETMSMTAAGAGSLMICRRQLAAYKRLVAAQNPYLVPVLSEEQRARIQDRGVRRRKSSSGRSTARPRLAGEELQPHGRHGGSPPAARPITPSTGSERKSGGLAGRDALGRIDWYADAAAPAFLNSTQQGGGGWTASYGDVPNTAWGVLFLTKSTSKTIERITLRRLGGGELFGGKGLPRDLSTISEAGGRLVAKPMDGAVEGMLTVLEDPRAENADSALAGLLARYRERGPSVLEPYKDRFRRLLNDPDQGIRRVASWALARTGDLAMVPVLAEALKDGDPMVVRETRSGLRLLSRKIDGFGPPDNASAPQRDEAAKAWTAWYESVRPLGGDRSSTQAGPMPARGRGGP